MFEAHTVNEQGLIAAKDKADKGQKEKILFLENRIATTLNTKEESQREGNRDIYWKIAVY